jgi:hypothetical protein
MLTDEMIIKYQQLVREHYNREISHDEALENGLNLIRLVELIYKPIKKAKTLVQRF